MQVPELSLVVPFFNEEEGCAAFFARVLPIVEGITRSYEIVCVNDGSEDRTAQLLAAQHLCNRRVKLLNLSRNFGKEGALTAGLDHARGRAVIPIDADLQDPPELIPELVARWREGFDVVLAVRADRRSDTLLKRITARLFYRLIGRMAEVPIPADVGDFRLLDRRVVDALKLLPERTRFMKGLFAWLGFRQARVEYRRAGRVAGASRWRYWRLWNFALEGLFSFSTLPLRIWTYAGLLVAATALALAVFIVVRTAVAGVDVPGYASLVVLVSLFGGINMVGLGIIGEYLGRIFTEVKGRPNYLIRDQLGFDAAEPQESLPQALLAKARRERARPA
jgi:glycosyltransferase involved in cell wall biosynthesis